MRYCETSFWIFAFDSDLKFLLVFYVISVSSFCVVAAEKRKNPCKSPKHENGGERTGNQPFGGEISYWSIVSTVPVIPLRYGKFQIEVVVRDWAIMFIYNDHGILEFITFIFFFLFIFHFYLLLVVVVLLLLLRWPTFPREKKNMMPES